MEIVERIEGEGWIRDLTDQERPYWDHLVVFLKRDATAQDRAAAHLDWRDQYAPAMDAVHQRAQLLGMLDVMEAIVGDTESLQALPWYQNLGGREQSDVLRTVKANVILRKAMPRQTAPSSQQDINKTNPWSRLLNL